jgi:hypothetical protein
VVANSIVSTYLVLSLPLSIVHIIRSRAKYSRLILIFFDAVRLNLLQVCMASYLVLKKEKHVSAINLVSL